MRRALILAVLLTAPAAGQGPPPPDNAPMIAASCGEIRTMRSFEQVSATVSPLTAEALPVEGPLRWRWGVRITTGDPRVANVTGMELNGVHGLLAVTRDRRWVSLDFRSGRLDVIHSVGIAAMSGASGVPTSVVTMTDAGTYVAFASPRPTVARFALDACGAMARAVPWIDVTRTTDPLIVRGAYTYLGIVGRRASDGSALVPLYQRGTVALAGSNPLGSPGETIAAAGNPARIVPEIVVARKARDSSRTSLTLVPVAAWSDVRGGPPTPATLLGTLPRPPAALATGYAARGMPTLVILAYPGPRAGTLDVYAFDTDVAL